MSKLRDTSELEYREWLHQALALLEGQNMMPSGEWVRLYVKGRPPEEAAAIAKTYNRPKGRMSDPVDELIDKMAQHIAPDEPARQEELKAAWRATSDS